MLSYTYKQGQFKAVIEPSAPSRPELAFGLLYKADGSSVAGLDPNTAAKCCIVKRGLAADMLRHLRPGGEVVVTLSRTRPGSSFDYFGTVVACPFDAPPESAPAMSGEDFF